MDEIKETGLTCPVPVESAGRITLAHGSGGTLSHRLITDIFLKEFGNEYLEILHDGAVFTPEEKNIAFTTDSYVVNPVFFPGGNIGYLAVNGTVNDLAMCGAEPLFISAAFIIEEGFLVDELKRIVSSMGDAARKCGVKIITGDTKVVDKGKGDKIFINTSGIGQVRKEIAISPERVMPGDKIILSGSIAEHGIAVLAERENLGFRPVISSDTAPVHNVVGKLLNVCRDVHVLRDPTRGGVAGILNELAAGRTFGMTIYENRIPVREEVKAACEILGFDPLYIANEGKFICILPSEEAEEALGVIKSFDIGRDASIIGEVTNEYPGMVVLRTSLGTGRVIEMMTGEQLPRIC